MSEKLTAENIAENIEKIVAKTPGKRWKAEHFGTTCPLCGAHLASAEQHAEFHNALDETFDNHARRIEELARHFAAFGNRLVDAGILRRTGDRKRQ